MKCLDKNLSREESLVKLREQVNELDKEYQSLLAEYEEKEKQQQDAFNVSQAHEDVAFFVTDLLFF